MIATPKTKTLLVTGIAGSGKTRLFKDKISLDPTFGQLCATTGVAAVNLGAQTIHSFMGFSDTDDMRRTVQYGGFFNKLKKRYEEGDLWPGAWVVIDEKSMLSAEHLDVIYDAFEGFNGWLASEIAYRRSQEEDDEFMAPAFHDLIGLALVGDFCQLAPIKGDYAFKARCWPKFEANRINLTGSYRQNAGSFLDGLNLARSGKGQDCVDLLRGTDMQFSSMNDMEFNGVTVFGTNNDVKWFNGWRYARATGEEFTIRAQRVGQQKKDWYLIPDELSLKVGCRVMITANETRSFTYANGDMGEIVQIHGDSIHGIVDMVSVLLDRNGATVEVMFAEREWIDPKYQGPKWKAKKDGRVIGSVSYMPLTLGYALTVHKTQGLTLDKVQFNISNVFTGFPAMAYTALSRARTPGGLHIVGTPSLLATRIVTHPEVSRWL